MIRKTGQLSDLVAPDSFQRILDFFQVRAGHLLEHFAVAHEDEVRPKFHPESAAQRFAFAVFNLDVPDVRNLLEQARQLRP